MDLAAIGGVAKGLKPTVDLAKSLVDFVGAGKGRDKALELYGQIVAAHQSAIAAQAAQSALLKEKDRLEQRVAELEAWELQKDRYELQQQVVGVFAYALKPEAGGSEPVHHICATCYEGGHKSILQKKQTDGARASSLLCPRCKTELAIQGTGVRPLAGRDAAGSSG